MYVYLYNETVWLFIYYKHPIMWLKYITYNNVARSLPYDKLKAVIRQRSHPSTHR